MKVSTPAPSQISTVERLDREMSEIISTLAAMGVEQAALNTMLLAALVKTLVDKSLISEEEWAGCAINVLKDALEQARKLALFVVPRPK